MGNQKINERVSELLAGERAYQDRVWGALSERSELGGGIEISDWARRAGWYADEAKMAAFEAEQLFQQAADEKNKDRRANLSGLAVQARNAAAAAMRKIGALAVACMECHETPSRDMDDVKTAADHNPQWRGHMTPEALDYATEQTEIVEPEFDAIYKFSESDDADMEGEGDEFDVETTEFNTQPETIGAEVEEGTIATSDENVDAPEASATSDENVDAPEATTAADEEE